MKVVKILLALLVLAMGVYSMAIGFTIKEGPYLNNLLFIGGFLLAGGAITYTVIQLTKS